MTIIIPDDIWKDVRKKYGRCARRLSEFIETHPEQHQCIAPTGEAVMDLGNLLRALIKANKDEARARS
jgi:hypothetical protein